MPSPASSGGSGGGGTVFIPPGQDAVAGQLGNIAQGFPQQASQTPAGQYYPQAQSQVSNYLTGDAGTFGGSSIGQALGGAQDAANYAPWLTQFGQGGANSLYNAAEPGASYAPQLLQGAFSSVYPWAVDQTQNNQYLGGALQQSLGGQQYGGMAAAPLFQQAGQVANLGNSPAYGDLSNLSLGSMGLGAAQQAQGYGLDPAYNSIVQQIANNPYYGQAQAGAQAGAQYGGAGAGQAAGNAGLIGGTVPGVLNTGNQVTGLMNPLQGLAGQVGSLMSPVTGLAGQTAGLAGPVSGLAGQAAGMAAPLAGLAGQQAGLANPLLGLAGQVGSPIAGLQSASGQVLNSGFDPQNALFNRTQQQVMDQANAANAAAGVGGTPYGASVTSNALGNFDINWQNQQLARQAQGLSSAGTGYSQAAGLGQASGGLIGQAGTEYQGAGGLLGQAGSALQNSGGLYGQAGNLLQGGGGLYGQAGSLGNTAGGLLGQAASAGQTGAGILGQGANIANSGLGLSSGASQLAAGSGALPSQAMLGQLGAQEDALNQRLSAAGQGATIGQQGIQSAGNTLNSQLTAALQGLQGSLGGYTGAAELPIQTAAAPFNLQNQYVNSVLGAQQAGNQAANQGAAGFGSLLSALTGGYGGAQTLGSNAAQETSALSGLPYQAGVSTASNALQGIGSATNLGNNQYALPQQLMSDLMQYMGLGQNASQISGQLGNLGVQQTANAIGGVGSLLGAQGPLGSSGALSGLGSGLGSLLGGGGAAADFGGGGAALGVADQLGLAGSSAADLSAGAAGSSLGSLGSILPFAAS